MKKRPTIIDVAKIAGVSIGTASQALNNRNGVSQYTIEKVKTAAKTLKYIPSSAARQLRSRISNVLSLHVIVAPDDAIHPSTWTFYFPIIQGFTNELKRNNYKMHLVFNNIQELSNNPILLNDLFAYNVHGVGFIATSQGDYSGLLTLKDYSIPVVTIYSRVFDSISSICIDNFNAAYSVTNWLLNLGHKNIIYISGPCSDFAAIDRKNGFIKAMKDREEVRVYEGDWDLESGSRELKKIISKGFLPSAIFCANDHMAIGVLKACKELRIAVPDKISLVGFDNTTMCEVSDPQITSVKMPLFEMGRNAAFLLLNSIHESSITPVHTLLSTELIVRNSVISK